MDDFSSRITTLSQKQLVLLATQLRFQLDKLETGVREPIAVIGIGCRFPGGADNAEAFWRILQSGMDTIQEIPTQRWDVDAFYDRSSQTPGKIATRWAGLIDRIDEFDAGFFGIAPREAISMDPQQRLLLEVAWEALERAGLSPNQLEGTQTGVFIGISSSDYYQLQMSDGYSKIDAYTASGNAHSVASGRLSYTLGLQGPCLSVDTACSSSLVAAHLAVQSLRNAECDMALAGGVNLILSPEITIALSKSEMMASDGRCKAFDARADGFVRGEGCGLLVLKRLSDAVRDNDQLLALIRGSAINQDGRSNGLTAPNGPSQEAVIRGALKDGSLGPGDIDYIEAHGTGTALGDPIEARALGAVFGPARGHGNPMPIGSVKTNIGHLEAAAGIAGLIKIILAIQHGKIPPHLHFKTPNPHIDWGHLPLKIPTHTLNWPDDGRRRRAGVSSFGFSGTNAHVIVEQAPEPLEDVAVDDRPLHLLTISAKSQSALKEQSARYARFLATTPHPLPDVCYTANTGRSRFNYRLALTVESSDQAKTALEAFAQDTPDANVQAGLSRKQSGSDLAFLFTGQGSQYIGMGKALYKSHPMFRDTIDRCDAALRPHIQKSLHSLLFPEDDVSSEDLDLLKQTEYTQPALFAIEYALAQLWRSWGVEPTVVMGHSLGEYVAACVAGLFSLEDGLALVARRAQLMQRPPGTGAMVAVFAAPERVQDLLAHYGDTVTIAAYNGPSNTVISGPASRVESVTEVLRETGIAFQKLQVSDGFHSTMVEPMLAAFEQTVSGIRFCSLNIGFVSNVTGDLASFEMLSDPAYWCRHTRQPVRFAESIQTLYRNGCRAYIESGPNPVLLGMASRIVPPEDCLWLPSLRSGKHDWQQMLQSLGVLYVNGFDLDWKGFDKDWPRRKVILPSYPFERKQFWTGHVAVPFTDSQRIVAEAWREWLYEFEWKEESNEQGDIAAADLPRTGEIVDPILSDMESLVAGSGVTVYDEFLPDLENACRVYVLQAFRRLGLTLRKGERLNGTALAERTGILHQHRRLLNRLLEILAEEEILRQDGSEWMVVAEADKEPESGSMLRALFEKYPACRAELELIGSCAGKIAEVMRGECDPMALLFPDGSLELTENMYQASPVQRFYNSVIRRVFSALAERLPDSGKLRILEIGAGTGSTTSFILPALAASRTEYVFTDVSEMFLTRAKRKFNAFPFVDYRLLDIDAAPQIQGCHPHSFDVIVAANVLHATPDIRRALANIRTLMTAGGMLVLLEGTDRQRFSDLTVGLTKGWWHFSDTDLRPSYALLSAEQWRRLLKEAGFDDIVFFPGKAGAAHPVLAQQSVIIARSPGYLEEPIDSEEVQSDAAWLIFADDAGHGRRLADLLRTEGGRSIIARKGDSFKRLDASTYSLDPLNPDHYLQLLNEAVVAGAGGLHRVAHMWSLDEATDADSPVADLESKQQRVCASVLYLIKAIAASAVKLPPRLALVTKDSQDVRENDKIEGFAQGSLWGLGRVVAMEHPELNCVRIDLGGVITDGDLAALLRELMLAKPADTQLAFREGKRYALRITKSPAGQKSGAVSRALFQSDAGYLITGGLAGLGIEIARWMVDHGARHLFLMGRNAPAQDSQKAIAGMKERGAQVDVFQGNVADRQSLEMLFRKMAVDRKPLRGIIHCAGTLDDGVLLQQSWDRFSNVMQAKVQGTWNLHYLTRHMDLDCFILFSSGAAFLGSSGQGNHAAANSFMDALAHYRRAAGLPALTINWGAWSQIGAASKEGVIQRLHMKGMGFIQPQEGLSVLGHLLQTNPVQIGVLPIRWPELLSAIGESPERCVFKKFEEPESPKKATEANLNGAFLEQLRSSPGKRSKVLFEEVQQAACRCLGLDPGQPLNPTQPLTELGLDSLMAVQLRNTLSRLVCMPLPATLLFNYPSLDELVRHLSDDVLHSINDEPGMVIIGTDTVGSIGATQDLDHYSEEEMENLLLEKLKKL